MKVIGGITFSKPRLCIGIACSYGLRELRLFNDKKILREYLLNVGPGNIIFTVMLNQEELDIIYEFYKHGLLDMAFEEIKKKHPKVIKQRFLHRFLGMVRRLFEFSLNKVLCMA